MADRQLITIQVFVRDDPVVAENVATRAADYITESFDDDHEASVQTVLVHSGPFVFTEGGIVLGSTPYDGDPLRGDAGPFDTERGKHEFGEG